VPIFTKNISECCELVKLCHINCVGPFFETIGLDITRCYQTDIAILHAVSAKIRISHEYRLVILLVAVVSDLL